MSYKPESLEQIKYSVIIPTCNRSESLARTIESAVRQNIDASQFELIVVDNASNDNTPEVAKSAAGKNAGVNIRYVYEQKPGLHEARHRGAFEASGDILCYLDDDVTLVGDWLEQIRRTFHTTNAAIVGGRVLPIYEIAPPGWLKGFVKKTPQGWYIWQLSIIDLGNKIMQVEPCYVFGCNFSIRKNVLFECGGFHPDAMPPDMIRFRGDGETSLCETARQKGYTAWYNPGVCVYHHIPSQRLTVDYFCERMFNQGISDAYAKIRKHSGMGDPVTVIADDAYHKGRAFLHEQALADPQLIQWILNDNYLHDAARPAEAAHLCSAPDFTGGSLRQKEYDKNS